MKKFNLFNVLFLFLFITVSCKHSINNSQVPTKCEITYISAYGFAPDRKTVEYGYELTEQDLPKLDDSKHYFVRWNKDIGFKILNNTTITAEWEDLTRDSKVNISCYLNELSDNFNNLENKYIFCNLTLLDEDFSYAELYNILYKNQMIHINLDISKSTKKTKVDKNAFYYLKNLISITLPDTIEEIDESAFSNCTSLKTINIPNSIISLGKEAFNKCENLKTVKLPANLETIKESAFSNCKNLTSITLPESVKVIETKAFFDTNVSQIHFPKNIEKIGYTVFSNSLETCDVDENNLIYDSRNNCNGIIEKTSNTLILGTANTIIPDSVNKIGSYAFSYSKLQSISIPETITEIGENAFKNCEELISIELPDLITDIKEYTFSNCTKLHDINFPDNLKTIGEYAFSFCNSLQELQLNEGLISIEDYAFYDSGEYTKIYIPLSLKTIGNSAFNGDKISDGIYYNGTLEDWMKIEFKNLYSNPLYYGYHLFLNNIELNGEVTLPESFTTVPTATLAGCYGITKINIPDCYTKIDGFAFAGCKNVTELKLSRNINHLGTWSLYYLVSLESITIPDSVTIISGYAFANCRNLKEIIFENQSGWYKSRDTKKISDIDVSDPQKNVELIGDLDFYEAIERLN